MVYRPGSLGEGYYLAGGVWVQENPMPLGGKGNASATINCTVSKCENRVNTRWRSRPAQLGRFGQADLAGFSSSNKSGDRLQGLFQGAIFLKGTVHR